MSANQKKRIVICADGTWNDPEDETPTNVLRVARAIQPQDEAGVQQVVFYDWGVGSYHDKVLGGTTGLGLDKNVQDGYRFIVQNYDPGDEVFLFGFSRGAYTARCLAGMLNNCGILKRTRAQYIPLAFDEYKKRRLKPSSAESAEWRKKYAHGPGRGLVDFLGVWDTVGALGIPTRSLAFVNERDLFFDPVLGSNVSTARHAVSIDEQREDFEPTLWTPKEATDMKQVWFAGVHSDIGGGVKPKNDQLLSEIALSWMAKEATTKGLRFEPHLVGSTKGLHKAEQNRSYRTFWRMLGKRERDLGKDAVVHASVQDRAKTSGYNPKPLQRWLEANGGWGAIEPW